MDIQFSSFSTNHEIIPHLLYIIGIIQLLKPTMQFSFSFVTQVFIAIILDNEMTDDWKEAAFLNDKLCFDKCEQ